MIVFSQIGFIIAVFILAVGTAWAHWRGAGDFTVFYEAWRLVLDGKGLSIYHATPDRFLYAPGFAWLFSPLGLLPKTVALAVWSTFKALAVGLVVRGLARIMNVPIGLVAWGVVGAARPVLIDMQYGQVNLLVMAAGAWALLTHFQASRPRSREVFVAWLVLGIAAASKLLLLPLALVPFISFDNGGAKIPASRLRRERAGLLTGFLLVLLAPVITEGIRATWGLHELWMDALVGRGLPLESHNQSFTALLHRYFSGMETHVIARGTQLTALGGSWLPRGTINLLSVAWTFITMGGLLAWLMQGPTGSPHGKRSPARWLAVAVAMSVLPAHLVWKPYFVLGIPVIAVAIVDGFKDLERDVGIWRFVALILTFLR